LAGKVRLHRSSGRQTTPLLHSKTFPDASQRNPE
jgi:hypothetical protein